ncbi:hypothetical protein N7456_002464 [Penicillium angulare]|uniref:non-specific serine/threonine protein kinase n=1 Tax=Penicillium angulare TaxID=116970 RepID=A0A9W9G958_9EURO|nr:hypothetical protein N7456_002464 [Penicillium angulare]
MRAFVSRFAKAAPYLGFSSTRVTQRYLGTLPKVTTSRSTIPLLPLRQLPTSGFVKVDKNVDVEEERISDYEAKNYYPVRLGEVFAHKYQVVSKLGFGTNNTTWLCRDLIGHGFKVMKVFVLAEECFWDFTEEVDVAHHIKGVHKRIDEPCWYKVDYLSSFGFPEEAFKIDGPSGSHTCLIYRPLGTSFTEIQESFPGGKLPPDLIPYVLQPVLRSLGFLHENHVVHADICADNLLQTLQDDSFLCEIEEAELTSPIARKVLDDREIYYSRKIPIGRGGPTLCQFGHSRIIDKNNVTDQIMDVCNRPPEVIFDADWGNEVDIWGIGMMVWKFATGTDLFLSDYDHFDEVFDFDAHHLAEMVSIMGPPPLSFLECTHAWETENWFDEKGNWKGAVPIPEISIIDKAADLYHGENKTLFTHFMSKIMTWEHDKRPTVQEIASHEFLRPNGEWFFQQINLDSEKSRVS